MFDVGFTEILLIGIVSLVVIGPERLPVVAKTAGQWIAKLQRFVKGVKTDLASELESGDLKKLIGDQREQINELKDMVSTAKKDFQSTSQSVVKSAKEGLAELETSVNDAKAEAAQSGVDSDAADLDVTLSKVASSEGGLSDARDDASAVGVNISKAQAASASNPTLRSAAASPKADDADSSMPKRTGTDDSDAQ